MDIKEIAAQFDLQGEIVEVKPLGNGLINDTYRVVTGEGTPDYVLQHINNAIFKDVELLQHNIEVVTDHIRKKLEAKGESDIDRKVLRYIHPKGSDKTYLLADGKYWRVSVFIEDSFTRETADEQNSYFAGKAFGNFEAMLIDVPEELGETIPDFHNMQLRSQQFKEAIANDVAGRVHEPEVQKLIADISKYDEEMCKAERLFAEGKLPKRICHCDTKVNNMLFDANGEILCVIDLDTVMPGFVFSDIGDFLRTAANTVAEDSPEYDKIEFKMETFKAFVKGYVESASCFLTPVEKENIPYAALRFPYMQAVRFFNDYLNGDTYYKIQYPTHNLVRTINQMTLFHSVLSHIPEMNEYVASL